MTLRGLRMTLRTTLRMNLAGARVFSSFAYPCFHFVRIHVRVRLRGADFPSPMKTKGKPIQRNGGTLQGSSQAPPAAPPKQPQRYRPGIVVVREIRKYQQQTQLVIPKLPYSKVVREISNGMLKEPFRWTAEALLALQD
ncbi:histone H3.3, partial [Tetrabaena socialis]